MSKLIYGNGYNDGSRPCKKNSKHLPQYEMWRGMLRRCYSSRERDRLSAYLNCSVSENFKSYSYFYDWYSKQIKNENIKYQLDKDLLIKGNKIYSENTCSLLPLELNVLITTAKWKRGKYLIGVSFRKKENRFHVQVSVGGKNKTVGYFKDEKNAYLAYKEYKENHIKDMAEKWKDSISKEAYDALMNYTVEITD